MPIETQTDHQTFVIQVVSEALIASEVIDAQRHLYLQPGYDPQRPVLWDTRTVDVKAGFSDILEMVEGSTELWAQMKGGKTAILVAERQHAMHARLYAKLAEAMPRELEVFTDYDAAVGWLDSTAGTSSAV